MREAVTLHRPSRVTFACALGITLGALSAIAGLFALFAGLLAWVGGVPGRSPALVHEAALILGIEGAVLVTWGGMGMFAGVGALHRKRWARWVLVLLFALGLLVDALLVASGGTVVGRTRADVASAAAGARLLALALVLVDVAALRFLLAGAATEWFNAREPAPVPAPTPPAW